MKEQTSLKYSIIIPHFNIPVLLERCIKSIPHRDDLQIIVVDDKSSNENVNELQRMAKAFPYVTFLYSDVNRGGGKARNVGLQHAKGKYVLFADADDFFNYCINDILDEYINTDYDIVFFNASFIDTNTYLPTERGTTLKSVVLEYERGHNMDLFRFLFGEPWCKLVNRNIIIRNHISFDEIPIHNDTKFSYLIGYYAKDVLFDNRALYCLADRTGSVSKGLTDEKWQIRTMVFSEKNQFLKNHNIGLFDDLMITPFWWYIKKMDIVNYKKCISISKQYGFGHIFIACKLIKALLCVILRTGLNFLHIK